MPKKLIKSRRRNKFSWTCIFSCWFCLNKNTKFDRKFLKKLIPTFWIGSRLLFSVAMRKICFWVNCNILSKVPSCKIQNLKKKHTKKCSCTAIFSVKRVKNDWSNIEQLLFTTFLIEYVVVDWEFSWQNSRVCSLSPLLNL